MKIPVLYQIEKMFNAKIKHPLLQKIDRYFIHKYRYYVLKKYKYIHVMNNGLHSLTILKFIKKNFGSEHAFIFPILKDSTKKQIKELENVYHYDILDIPLNYVKKIIFHGLFTRPFIEFLYKNPKYLKKSYWFIWGGDLYNVLDDKKSSFVKKNIQAILTSFDYEYYKQKFGNKKCYDVTYPHNIQEKFLKSHKSKKRNEINILVNNCADKNTLTMLEILKKFKNENIKIHTILSYISQGQNDLRLEIMNKGYKIFGTKFNPIIEFMSEEKYYKFLSSIDVYVSNQNRSQGNGNASYILIHGGKVFTSSKSGVYKKYNKIGIKYFNVSTIKNLNFQDFIEYKNETKNKSIKLLKERMKNETKIKQWSNFFND